MYLTSSFIFIFITLICGQINQKIIIDPLYNEKGGSNLAITVTCGPNGVYCNTQNDNALRHSLTQSGPWRAGENPIGGARYQFLSIDNISPNYTATGNDIISLNYDQTAGVDILSSPALGGTYTFMWGGSINYQLPCFSSVSTPCPLDGVCCTNQPGFIVGNINETGDGYDLTAAGTQMGISIFQLAANKASPIILRIFREDGKSIILRKSLFSQSVQQSILFLYKDFTGFLGDSPVLSDSEVQDVLKNARSIVLQIFGAIGLNAQLSSITTVGIDTEYKVDDSCAKIPLFYTGDSACWNLKIRNNAPQAISLSGNDNSFILKDVYAENSFLNTYLNLNRSSVKVSVSRSKIRYDLHRDSESDPNLLQITITEMQPQDLVTIFFCGIVKNVTENTACGVPFCNEAMVQIPDVMPSVVTLKSACVNVCPSAALAPGTPDTMLQKIGMIGLMKFKISYENKGSAIANDVVLTEHLPVDTTFVSEESDEGWVCVSSKCTINIGSVSPGSRGNVAFSVMPIGQSSSSCFESAVEISYDSESSDPTPFDNHAKILLGNCAGLAQCADTCEKCPDCICEPPSCNCTSIPITESQTCSCPPKVCSFPGKSCPQKECNCPPLKCDRCPDCISI